VGPDEPVDLGLRGGESIRVDDRSIDVARTGHTPGHGMRWGEDSGVLIVADGLSVAGC